ncbi:hypothetical protein HRbin08_00586 [bacterium HR08]|nr:hypothetical protein HRbin08_00586 [bacterium HR08]
MTFDVSNVIRVVIARIITLFFAAEIARRQERARLDLKRSHDLARHVRDLIRLFKNHEQWLDKRLQFKPPPSDQGMAQISPEELKLSEELLWHLIRGADDPDLSKKKRERFLDKLKRITPRRFEYLSPPKPPANPLDQAAKEYAYMLKVLNQVGIGSFDLVGGAFPSDLGAFPSDLVDKGPFDLVDIAVGMALPQSPEGLKEHLKVIRKLIKELEQLLSILGVERPTLRQRIKQWLTRMRAACARGRPMWRPIVMSSG